MENTQTKVKVPYNTLEYGDIVQIRAPFEENMPEYYNGYSVYDVRGYKVRDSMGMTYKFRPVMVISVTEDELTYIPLTSSYGGEHDDFYQYQLKDNSMTPQYGDKPITTYAETGNVRVIPIRADANVTYCGAMTHEDKTEITKMLNRHAFNVIDGLDEHKFMSEQQKEVLENRLEVTGYEQTPVPNGIKYTQENREFTIYDSGVVYYHFELPLETIIRRTEVRDNITIVRPDVVYEDTSFEQKLKELNGSPIYEQTASS